MNINTSQKNARYNKKIKDRKINQTFILEDDEKYKPIINNPKYYITNKGRIYSTITCKFLNPSINNNGYYTTTLSNRKTHYIHRLLGLHFIDNPDNLPMIDHIDRDKSNNNIDNLRWSTCLDNNLNSLRVMNRKGSITFTSDTRILNDGTIKTYHSYRAYWYTNGKRITKRFKTNEEAVEYLNIQRSI